MSFFSRLKDKIINKSEQITESFSKGLSKSREKFKGALDTLFSSSRLADEAFYEELEEILLSSDVGATTTMQLVDNVREIAKRERITELSLLKEKLFEQMSKILQSETELKVSPNKLTVYLFVGVNGVGKTTSIGKLASQLKGENKKVVLAAGDTFRAGSVDQIAAWGERVGADVVKHNQGADPAAVIYDALQAAKARQADVLLCDTAGRLHNKVNLMQELNKIRRVIEREVPDAPHEVLLVIDATTGQNALLQAKAFSEAVEVSGIVLTKIDGTAKGGIVLAINNELKIPVKLLGLGEKVDDLQQFDPNKFLDAVLS